MKAIEEWRLKRPKWFVDAVINFRPNEGDGWSEIVDELLTSIEEAVSGTGVELRIGQIKEKIESLRFYSDWHPRTMCFVALSQKALRKHG